MAPLFVVFRETTKLFALVAAPVYIPTNSVGCRRLSFSPHSVQHLLFVGVCVCVCLCRFLMMVILSHCSFRLPFLLDYLFCCSAEETKVWRWLRASWLCFLGV